MKNSILGGYAVTVGYPEPVPLGDNDNISLTLQNTIFAFNGLDSPTGLWIGEGVNLTSQNCIYYSRDFEEVYLDSTQYSVTREDINNGYLGNNFGVDPEFVSESDFHLKPTSPAIDAGIPAVGIDIEHNLRPYGNGYDIGCYEYVEAVNQPPFAEFTNQPLTPFTGEIVTFDASQSSDDSIITLYTWDFGDGSEETTSLPVITHVYSQPGLYVVTLTVTDNSGLTSSKSKQITVQEAGLADLDSDGWSDFAEVAAGTDPRDVSSYPSIQQKVMRVLPSIDSIANEFNVTLTINGTVDLIVELIPENFTFVSSTGYQIHDNRVVAIKLLNFRRSRSGSR